MKTKSFAWKGPAATAAAARSWFREAWEQDNLVTEVDEIGKEVVGGGDAALLRLTEQFDGVALTRRGLRVDPGEIEAALKTLDPALREAMELAAANIRTVAQGQVEEQDNTFSLPQGQVVRVRDVPVSAVGIYAPGGRATYPSSVLMCAIPARVAGVARIALASPPAPSGRPADAILAAAALCGIDEVYAVGGAQAIFALAWGTESIPNVDVVVGPGNPWVQEAKRRAFGRVGIESFAGPSELMVIAGHDTDPRWAAADLCAQAEHGVDSPLLVAAVEEAVLEAIGGAAEELAATRPSVADAPLALVPVPDTSDAIDLANAFSPEHLELMEEDAALLADKVTTAGCVFLGRHGATAFGDYVAGSNHVLPTTKSGRFAGPLGPGTFRRKISTVEVSAEAAAKLAPYVDTIACAEGLPVHGESAKIRTKDT
jgi:histidinol dehydrogenase